MHDSFLRHALVSCAVLAAAPPAVVALGTVAAAMPPSITCAAPTLLPDEGFGAEAIGVSPGGVITGDVTDTDGRPQPAIWRHGRLTLVPIPGLARGFAADANASGLVVGQGLLPGTGRVGWAWDGHRATVLTDPYGGGNTQVRRVNAAGVITGTADDLDGLSHPVIWPSTTAAPVVLTAAGADPGGYTHGIANDGTVAGTSDLADNSPDAATLWSRDRTAHALLGLGGPAEAWDVAADGRAVGYSLTGSWDDPATTIHAVTWASDGTVTDLGTLPGDDDASAVSISSNGLVVGTSGADLSADDDFLSTGFIATGGHLSALPFAADEDPTTWASIAHDVTPAGQVVGSVISPDGTGSAVMWQCAATS